MCGRRQNSAFRNGLFLDRISITIRADRARLRNPIISMNHFFDKGDIS